MRRFITLCLFLVCFYSTAAFSSSILTCDQTNADGALNCAIDGSNSYFLVTCVGDSKNYVNAPACGITGGVSGKKLQANCIYANAPACFLSGSADVSFVDCKFTNLATCSAAQGQTNARVICSFSDSPACTSSGEDVNLDCRNSTDPNCSASGKHSYVDCMGSKGAATCSVTGDYSVVACKPNNNCTASGTSSIICTSGDCYDTWDSLATS